MNIIVCFDNNNGLMFNNRRQSQDAQVRQDILKLTQNSKLFMNTYSAKQFSEPNNIIVADDFCHIAGTGDYCFVENIDISPFSQKIDKIIIYKWNRNYPSDFKFGIDLSHYTLITTRDFAGNSHDKITQEVYSK